MGKLIAGDKAPHFALPNEDGKLVSLADFTGKKVILYFYPAAMSPGCTTQAVDFGKAFNSLTTNGYDIIGVSPDTPEKLAHFRAKENIIFKLLSDVDKVILTAYHAYGKKKLYGKTLEGVIRSTFVINVDEDGRGHIRLAQYNVRATGHVHRLCRELGILK